MFYVLHLFKASLSSEKKYVLIFLCVFISKVSSSSSRWHQFTVLVMIMPNMFCFFYLCKAFSNLKKIKVWICLCVLTKAFQFSLQVAAEYRPTFNRQKHTGLARHCGFSCAGPLLWQFHSCFICKQVKYLVRNSCTEQNFTK